MPHDPFYGSKQWRDTRASYLRLHPWCEFCRLTGLQRKAIEVDHRRAIRQGGALFDHANLRGLCKIHHAQKTFQHDAKPGTYRKPIVITGPDGYPVYVEK